MKKNYKMYRAIFRNIIICMLTPVYTLGSTVKVLPEIMPIYRCQNILLRIEFIAKIG
jgi:hypothetical protein